MSSKLSIIVKNCTAEALHSSSPIHYSITEGGIASPPQTVAANSTGAGGVFTFSTALSAISVYESPDPKYVWILFVRAFNTRDIIAKTLFYPAGTVVNAVLVNDIQNSAAYEETATHVCTSVGVHVTLKAMCHFDDDLDEEPDEEPDEESDEEPDEEPDEDLYVEFRLTAKANKPPQRPLLTDDEGSEEEDEGDDSVTLSPRVNSANSSHIPASGTSSPGVTPLHLQASANSRHRPASANSSTSATSLTGGVHSIISSHLPASANSPPRSTSATSLTGRVQLVTSSHLPASVDSSHRQTSVTSPPQSTSTTPSPGVHSVTPPSGVESARSPGEIELSDWRPDIPPSSSLQSTGPRRDSINHAGESQRIECEQAFTGTAGLTCHQFIRSVRERAIEAGKQRDDSWMADHASIRFDGDALKWFESLDDETQVDWKQLRRAILARYATPAYEEVASSQSKEAPWAPSLKFNGESEAERQEFVRKIRQGAIAEGKRNDSGWMVRLAFSAFNGTALQWYMSLPSHVQNSWRNLEEAILRDYPHQPSSSALSPARIQVSDWYSYVPPSPTLSSIKSYTEWLSQARERRKLYEAAKNKSTPCWLLVEAHEKIPDNVICTGTAGTNLPLYSGRLWYKDFGLLLGKCGVNFPGPWFALNSQEFGPHETLGAAPFEVLVGDPSHFKWVAIPEKPKHNRFIGPSPFVGVEAGFENVHSDRVSFISQVWIEGMWVPGKVHSGDQVVHAGFSRKEWSNYNIRVLAWAD